jgi:large subunit ribosomal protein L31
MKANIHPKWNHQAKVTCACGATFLTGSMQDGIVVDICSKCHPFFTGEMRFVDRQGRVDKFLQKMTSAQQKQAAAKAAKQKKTGVTPDEQAESKDVLSYKQLLQKEQEKLKNMAKNRGTSVPASAPASVAPATTTAKAA